jgi:hypothetical protein
MKEDSPLVLAALLFIAAALALCLFGLLDIANALHVLAGLP